MSGISAFPEAIAADTPGVTISALSALTPGGLTNAAPNAPTAAMWRAIPVGTVPGVAPLSLTGGVASNVRVVYRADEDACVLQVGNGAGDSSAFLFVPGTQETRYRVAEGPWKVANPGNPEPALAVCGWKATIRHLAAATVDGCGHGFLVGGTAAGNPWLGGPLAAEGGNFRNDGTRPYIALEAPPGGGPLRIRCRGNDGVVRLFAPEVTVNPLQHYTADWRVYRATRQSPARYALYLNGALAFSYSMAAGAGGAESASPSGSDTAVLPMIWQALQNNKSGCTIQNLILYTGYDSRNTTDRG